MGSVQLSAEFSRLVVQAEMLLEEVQRDHRATAAEVAELGGSAALLARAATKKVEQRVATTRKAIADHDEPTLRDCVERLIALRAFAAAR